MGQLKNTKHWILLLFVAAILVSGCVDQDEEPEPGDYSVVGVKSSFFSGAPPSVLGENTPFEVSVQVENTGGHTIPAAGAAVHLRGINPRSFLGLGSTVLEATQLLSVQEFEGQNVGGVDVLTWQNMKYLVDIDSDQKIKIVAQTCYDYTTTAKAEVCFNQNAYAQTTGAETCKVQGNKNVKNTGAPVHVAELIENPAGLQKFRFIIKIQNLGSGTIYDNNIYDEGFAPSTCINAEKSDLDKVYITDIKLGQYSLMYDASVADILDTESCTWRTDEVEVEDVVTKYRYVRLVEDEGQFMCTFDLTGQFYTPVFSDILSIDLEYGYMDQITASTKVEAIPGVKPTI